MTEVFLKQAGIEMLHVPYRGASPALADLAGGHVDIVIDTLIATSAFVDQGKAHWLGLGGDKRSPSQPNVPTFMEQGYAEFGAYSWGSVYGPSKIPPIVMSKLNSAVSISMQTPVFKARIQQVGGEQLGPVSPQQADEFALKERSKWVPFIKNSGIVAE
jgi:tripartite-type tricarboxylate transporter receptor subunit TctC